MKIHRRSVVLAALAAVALPCTRAPLAAQQAPARAVRARVDSLLARMTLEEKVGQMTQIDLPNFLAAGAQSPDSVRLDLQKLRTGIVQRHIGSILNSPGSAPTVKGWNGLIRQIQDVATRETRLRIPVLYGVDAVHGVNYTVDATIFPQNIGMAATFDSALARREGEIVAAELTAAVEKVPAVRQWVPKQSSRPAVLQPRSKPPVPAVSAPSAPAAPVTPKRAPVASAPATPTRTRKPAPEAAMFSDWLDEFDLAMTGDVEARDLESTEGGTVITGPERFDVLITPPLWPDVPLDDKHTTRRAG